MQFTFDKTILSTLQAASEAAGKNIMSNVKLSLIGNDLSIQTSDVKIFFSTLAQVEGKDDGECLVSVTKLCEIIGSLKAEPIDFKIDDGKAIIKQGRSRLTLRTVDSGNFIEAPEQIPCAEFTVDASVLVDIASRVAYAVSDDEVRYFMNGVYLEIKDNKLISVATDAKRLSVLSHNIQSPDVKGIIIPPRTIAMLAKRARGNVTLSFDGKSLRAEFDNTIIHSVVIDGQFPNYRKVIPESQKYKIVANRKDVLDGLNRVGLFTDSKSRRMFLEVINKTMILSSDDSDIGDAKEELEVDHSGESVKIALNSLFLVDVLKSSYEEKITIEYTEPSRALTLTDGSGVLNIIMPMQGSD